MSRITRSSTRKDSVPPIIPLLNGDYAYKIYDDA